MPDPLDAFLRKWTSAELAGDPEVLATLLSEDFTAVGPVGFILDRPGWVDRHRQGLAYEQFSLEQTQIRRYGDVAVVTARNNVRGTYSGQPLPEALRTTLVIASQSERVRLAAIHMSFIAGTHGSPSMSGPTGSGVTAATDGDRKQR
jgi:hypothetical protein